MAIFKTVSGSGPDVVLLHGWGFTHRYFQGVEAQLNDRYRVHNFDLPGRGKSEWNPDNQSMSDMVDQLLPQLPEKAIYLGWSIGGPLAMDLASRFPERVERLIGIGTSPKFIETEGWPGFPAPGFRAVFEPGVEEVGFAEFIKAYFDGEFEDFDPKPASYHQAVQFLEEDGPGDKAVFYRGMDFCDQADYRQVFADMQCPIDLILGNKDASVAEASYPHIQALNSNAKLHIIQDAQHMPMFTHPEQFNQVLSTLL